MSVQAKSASAQTVAAFDRYLRPDLQPEFVHLLCWSGKKLLRAVAGRTPNNGRGITGNLCGCSIFAPRHVRDAKQRSGARTGCIAARDSRFIQELAFIDQLRRSLACFSPRNHLCAIFNQNSIDFAAFSVLPRLSHVCCFRMDHSTTFMLLAEVCAPTCGFSVLLKSRR